MLLSARKIVMTIALTSLSFFSLAAEPKTIAITAIVEHPSLNEIKEGVIDELHAQGYVDNKDIIIQYASAQGSSATAAQIAKQFVGNKADIIVPIATPSAQAVAAATKTIPIVFSGITDPIAARLIKDWQPTQTNITGVSDRLPLAPQVELLTHIVPNLKAVGYVYSPGEVNSTAQIKQLQDILETQNIKLVAVPAQRTSDVAQAVRSLKGRADVIYTTTDNNVVSGYETLVKFANENKIPLVASFPDAIDRGAVAALGMSYYEVGRQSGRLVARLLRGEKAGDIAPEIGGKTNLVLNLDAAKLQGVKLSDSLISQASKVIGSKN